MWSYVILQVSKTRYPRNDGHPLMTTQARGTLMTSPYVPKSADDSSVHHVTPSPPARLMQSERFPIFAAPVTDAGKSPTLRPRQRHPF